MVGLLKLLLLLQEVCVDRGQFIQSTSIYLIPWRQDSIPIRLFSLYEYSSQIKVTVH